MGYISSAYIVSIALKAASALLSVIVSIYLARSLSQPDFGLYSFYLAIAMAISVPFHVGMPNLVVREISRIFADSSAQEVDQSLNAGRFMRYCIQVMAIGSAAILGSAALVSLMLESNNSNSRLALFVILAAMPLTGLTRVLEAYLQARGNTARGQIIEKLLFPAFNITFAAIIFALVDADPITAGVAYLSASILGLIAIFGLSRSRLWSKTHAATRTQRSEWTRLLIPLTALAAMNLLMTQTDLIMMGTLLNPEEVAIYRVGLTLSALATFFIAPLSVVLAPRIARDWNTCRRTDIQAYSAKLARLCFGASLLLISPLLAFSNTIIATLYGQSYSGASAPLMILCLGQVFNIATGFVHVILNMTHHHNVTLRGVGIALFANIVLNASLIPHFGIIGGASATAAAIILGNVYLLARLKANTGINSSIFG